MLGRTPSPTPDPEEPEQEPSPPPNLDNPLQGLDNPLPDLDSPPDLDAQQLLNLWDHGASPPIEIDLEEELLIKVIDGSNEFLFKIEQSTQFKELMDAFCTRTGKAPPTVRFLFDGLRVLGSDRPEDVSLFRSLHPLLLPQMLTMPTFIAGYARWGYY